MTGTVLKLIAITLSAIALFVISNRSTQAEPGPDTIAPQDKPVEQTRANIKVLTGLPDSQLIPVMNFMSASLGRRCNFCHITDKGREGYALDEKPEKNTAREMIRMVLELHKKNFPGAGEISCFTCHRGSNQPVSVPSLPLPVPTPRSTGGGSQRGGSGPPPSTAPGAPTAPAARAANSTTQPLPSADEIFGKYIAAIGGQANLDKIRTRTMNGSTTQANGVVTFEISQAPPDKFHIVATTPTGAFERGFNGSVGWEKGPRGVRQMSPDELAQLQNSIGFWRHIRLKEQFASTRVRMGEKIGDRATYMIIGTTRENRQERLFFDVETGLLLRRISYLTTLIGLIPDQIDFEDYRDVGGVKFPFVVRVSAVDVGNPVSSRTFTEMKLNAAVDEAKFNMPAANP